MSTIMHVQYVVTPSFNMTCIISDTTEAVIR